MNKKEKENFWSWAYTTIFGDELEVSDEYRIIKTFLSRVNNTTKLSRDFTCKEKFGSEEYENEIEEIESKLDFIKLNSKLKNLIAEFCLKNPTFKQFVTDEKPKIFIDVTDNRTKIDFYVKSGHIELWIDEIYETYNIYIDKVIIEKNICNFKDIRNDLLKDICIKMNVEYKSLLKFLSTLIF